MQLYQIWAEGFTITGDSGAAYRYGEEYGESFKDACKTFAKKNPDFFQLFDEERMTCWGCRLFESEQEARKSFG